jgi:putative holliday junction resolvase
MYESDGNRIMAIDFGLKRVGLALSDPMKIFSYPYMTIPYNNTFIKELLQQVKENSVSKIILGYPLESSGAKTPLSDEVMKLKKEMETKMNIEVILWDERFTSLMAKQRVIESVTKKSKRSDKGLLDQNSAAIMLQEFLDKERKT